LATDKQTPIITATPPLHVNPSSLWTCSLSSFTITAPTANRRSVKDQLKKRKDDDDDDDDEEDEGWV
jgi:hypothetical protein